MEELSITLISLPHHAWGRYYNIQCYHEENQYLVYFLTASRKDYPKGSLWDFAYHPDVKYDEKKLPVSIYSKIHSWWEKVKTKTLDELYKESTGMCLGGTIYKLSIEGDGIEMTFDWTECYNQPNTFTELVKIIREC
ncbi:MAG: hypothetical protein NE327_09460 [Lentisphaeraceae bacterium]|nr:hypothetical protein [Lentisphaeraceae bacterium]